MYAFPLAGEILKEALGMGGGYLAAGRVPGLGVTVDESVVERYPWIPWPWPCFRSERPAETRAVVSDHGIPWEEM